MHTFTVKNTRLTDPDTLLLSLQPKHEGDTFDFWPGQYAAIGYKHHGRPSKVRCFSMVNSPNNSDELQFAMRVQGDFTHALAKLSVGDTVFVHGPFGDFVIDERYDRNVVLLAAGIGITPFMSMIRHATETKSTTPITLLYSCRSQDAIPFYEELLELAQQNPRVQVIFFITNGKIDKLNGVRAIPERVNETHLQKLTGGRYNQFTYFLCGPRTFLNGTKAVLTGNGTEAGRVITEEFTPSAQENVLSILPKSSISRWTYSLAGASLALGAAFIMFLDLSRAVPKLLHAQTNQTPAATQTQPTNNTDDTGNTATAPTQSQPVTRTNQSSQQTPVTSVS